MTVIERALEVVAESLATDRELPGVKYRAQQIVTRLAAEGLLARRRVGVHRAARKPKATR